MLKFKQANYWRLFKLSVHTLSFYSWGDLCKKSIRMILNPDMCMILDYNWRVLLDVLMSLSSFVFDLTGLAVLRGLSDSAASVHWLVF